MQKLIFFRGPSGLSYKLLPKVGSVVKETYTGVIGEEAGFAAEFVEVTYSPAIQSPWEIPNIQEIYTSISLTDGEVSEFESGMAGAVLASKLQDAIGKCKQFHSQWHPLPHTAEEIKRMVKENTDGFHKGRKKYALD